MSQCGCFEQTLHYVSPSHGGWGVVRIAAALQCLSEADMHATFLLLPLVR